MGLFNFLKKKEQPTEIAEPENSSDNSTGKYLGDLSKTNRLFELVATPLEERDEKWNQAFLENIVHASFCCGDPQIISGPDGFPYFQLFLPKPHTSFQCYVIDNMKDYILSSGYGIAINPNQNGVDWVLSYGDMLNLKLNGNFAATKDVSFSKEIVDETIIDDLKVLIAQPSEELLPKQVRTFIAEFLRMNGIENPKVVLMMRNEQDSGAQSHDIVFNITPENFVDEETFRWVMQSVSWFLPRHYSFVGMSEQSLENGFEPL